MISETFRYLKEEITNLDIFKVVFEDTTPIKNLAQKFTDCEKVLVFGTGGSSLGGKCLVNFQAMTTGCDPRVLFIENVDVLHFLNIVKRCDPKKTGVIVISKSGRTTETLMLFLTLCEIWKDFDYAHKAIAITEFSENNDLRMLAESKKMEIIEHNPRIGGRFSVFSVVGLLPASIAGVDIDLFKQAARDVLKDIIDCSDSEECAIFNDICSLYQDHFKSGKVNELVIMAYSDMLEDYEKWAVQLFSESLGKTENFGITPIRAIGTVDQHSMLQLFLGGPPNKAFNIIIPLYETSSFVVNSPIHGRILDQLNGHGIKDLLMAHAKATIDVLKKKGPVRVNIFTESNVSMLGNLMMQDFVEVVLIAKLAEVNPFDQPAVEESKKIAMEYLKNQRS